MSTNILEGTHPAPKFRRRGTPRGFRALTKEVPTCPGHFSVTCDLSQIWRSGCLPLATYNMSVYPFKKASWDSTTDWFWVVIFMYCTTWCPVVQKSGNGELQHFGGLATNKSHGGFTGWLPLQCLDHMVESTALKAKKQQVLDIPMLSLNHTFPPIAKKMVVCKIIVRAIGLYNLYAR